MSTLEPLAGTAAALPWFAWEPLTPGNGLTLAALVHGLETVIERTAPGTGRETA